MKMILCDKYGKSHTINNPTHIPRVGDRVEWVYDPPPTVVAVKWCYDTKSMSDDGAVCYVILD